MRFKLVETGKSYAEAEESIPDAKIQILITEGEDAVPPIIWETGNVGQIRSLLVLREAELILAKAQLTGNGLRDWYTKNKITDLEIKIAKLKEWLAEAMEKDNRYGK